MSHAVETRKREEAVPGDGPSRALLLGCPDLGRSLRRHGFVSVSVRGISQLLEPSEGLDARVIVLGGSFVQENRLELLLPELRTAWPLVDLLVWAPGASGQVVREALRAGASDVILTDSVDSCSSQVAEAVDAQQLLPLAVRLGDVREQPAEFEGMASRSRRMWDLFDTVTRVAPADAAVLILGGTGTGKELLARAVHRRSGRVGRFVAVNCGAIPEALIDSELFGHVKGAFTGASTTKEGLFRWADGGTLMLDEIGNLPLAAQYRLLRVLQEGSLRPVGGHEEASVDVRVIAATSSDLEEETRRGRFREDLFYRLDVIRLEVPPLRDRPEDIVFLFAIFARRIAEQYNLVRPELSDGFLDALVEYDWPGNVRQLENFAEHLLLTHTARRVTVRSLKKLLPFQVSRPPRGTHPEHPAAPPPGDEVSVDPARPLREVVDQQVERVERAYLEACLRENGGRIGATASQAGISRRTLARKLSRYRLDKGRFRAQAE